MGSKYHGLNQRGKKAIKAYADLTKHIRAINDADGKVTATFPKGDQTLLVFCPKTGPGKRSTITVTGNEPVRTSEIRRKLERTATPA